MAKLSDEAYVNTPYFWKNSFRKNLKIKILDERKECESNIEKYPCQKKNWIENERKNRWSLLRYNPTDRKTLQSYKLSYFIKQLVIFLTRSDSWRQYGTYVR